MLNQQVPSDEIRQTTAILDAIVSRDGSAWGKFDFREEIAYLPEGEAPYCSETLNGRAMTS